MPSTPDSAPRRTPRGSLTRTEWLLLAYAVFGGALWTALLFDGSMGGFVNGLIAFSACGIALAYFVSRFEDRARDGSIARAELPDHDRERPPVNAGLRWSRRAAIALGAAGLVGTVIHREALARKEFDPEFIVSVLVIALAIFVIVRIDRRQLRDSDAWLAARKAARSPGRVEPEPLRPLHVHEPEGEPLHHRRPAGREFTLRLLERLLIAFAVMGLPACMYYFDFGGGFVAYTGGIIIWLAAINILEGWSARGPQVSNNAAEQRRFQERIQRSRGIWAANPPRVLMLMRYVFLSLVVIGAIACLIMPTLRDASPAERYRPTVVFVAGFLIGLALLGYAERVQRRLEQQWLEDRRAERKRTA